MTVIEMSVVLIVLGIIIASAVSFFLPAMKLERYRAEDAGLTSAVSRIEDYVKKNLHTLPEAGSGFLPDIVAPGGKRYIYKTNHNGVNICGLPPAAEAFSLDTGGGLSVVLTAAQLQARVNCPVPKILPGKVLPDISHSSDADIKFITTTGTAVNWCITASERFSKANIASAGGAGFVTPERNANNFDCRGNPGFQTVTAGNSMTLTIPKNAVPAGVYNLTVFISSTPDMAGTLDMRTYALAVRP